MLNIHACTYEKNVQYISLRHSAQRKITLRVLFTVSINYYKLKLTILIYLYPLFYVKKHFWIPYAFSKIISSFYVNFPGNSDTMIFPGIN